MTRALKAARKGELSVSLLDFLHGRLRLPVIASPLFIISVPDLVVAQCCAGIVGSMPSLNARPIEQLDEWLDEIRERLAAHDAAYPERPSAPFAINLIVHKSNDRLDEDLALIVKHRVPLIINRPVADLDPGRRWRNFDAFDLALNRAQ